jgi:hypothetical protein
MTVAETGEEQAAVRRGRGGKWAAGASGNPRGRPAGARNRTTKLCADLLSADADVIFAKVIKMAKKGDGVALKLCIERLLPVRAARDRIVELNLPAVRTAADLVSAAAVVIEGVAAGEMSLSEGKEFMALFEHQRRVIETSELAVRIEALVQQEARGQGPALDPEAAARVRSIVSVLAERREHL